MPKGIYVRTKPSHWKGKKLCKKTKAKITATKLARKYIGEKAGHWKGGIIKNYRGYILVKIHNHPFATHNNYVREHRLVIEKQIGRYLWPKEKCHHLGARDDNRPHMLMAFASHSAHKRFEQNGKVTKEEIIFDGRKKEVRK